MATEPATSSGLTIRQRREMGLTIANVRRATKELKAAGQLEGLSHDEIAVLVLDKLVSDNPKAFADAGIDWDALLAFIEKLLPLILQLIALFG